MKTHIIIIKGTDDCNLLKTSISDSTYGYSYQEIDRNKLKKIWNISQKKYDTVVCSNYMIESKIHVQFVFMFIKSLQIELGNMFYSPRPNSYVAVDDSVLFGSTVKNCFKTVWLSRVYGFVRSIARKFPRPVKMRLGKMEQKITLRYWRRKTSRKVVVESVAPVVSIPSSLSELSGPWREWRDSEVLRHDLVDRNHLYFPHPVAIHVAVFNKCNLKCVMCPYHSPVYQSGHTSGYFDDEKSLSLYAFEKLAEYAGQRGISFQFGQIEETLLHPHIFDFIRIAKLKGVPYVHLTTNGTLLTEKKADSLVASGVDSIMFSIDSVDPGTYKQIRGASLEKLEHNIEYFLSIAKKRGIRVVCSFIRQEPALKQRDAFLEKWKTKGVDGVSFYVLSEHDPSTGKFVRSEQFRRDTHRYPCAAPWIQTVIMPDGSVGLCCKTMVDIGWKITSVGNIYTQDLDVIWNSDMYKTLRSEVLNNKFCVFLSCVDCPIWSASTNLVEYGNDYVRSYNETMETIIFVK